MKFRKRPVEIEAIQVPFAANYNLRTTELADWLRSIPRTNNDFIEAINIQPTGEISIDTLEGEMIARPGDWIIKGVAGEFYPCKPDIFVKTYEPVTDD